jgi:hypothetical protein
MAAPTSEARQAARALLEECPDDAWGLHTVGAFKSDLAKRAAWKWLELVVEEFGGATDAIRALGLDDTVRRRIAMLIHEGRTTERALPRNVAAMRKALGGVAEKPLPPPDIPGATGIPIRRRMQWVRVWHYEYYLTRLAQDMGVDRSYVAHFLNDPHRNLSPTLLAGMEQAGFRAYWIARGEGRPWRGKKPYWIGTAG